MDWRWSILSSVFESWMDSPSCNGSRVYARSLRYGGAPVYTQVPGTGTVAVVWSFGLALFLIWLNRRKGRTSVPKDIPTTNQRNIDAFSCLDIDQIVVSGQDAIEGRSFGWRRMSEADGTPSTKNK